MKYHSTRNSRSTINSAEAITRGIAPDGGLFVPAVIPCIPAERFAALENKNYIGRACEVLSHYLTDFSAEEIETMVTAAYENSFDECGPAPLVRLGGSNAYMLELWHGPTCAFKDMALQLLPHLMVKSAEKIGDTREIVVLVATSGDTGKAALEGFKNVPGTKIVVFYPEDGVSNMQKLQMATQQGQNVYVSAINGNFDDAQTAVKSIFANADMIQKLSQNDMVFSSANSINWGRLVPQIVYYVSSYLDLKTSGADVSAGINVVVPTGNFGNILAAYYAKMMGVPIAKLICASNRNNVLTDFIKTGCYDRNREFFATSSPSMDILISSNLERLLYHVSAGDDMLISELMRSLSDDGTYKLPAIIHRALQADFYGGFCSEEDTLDTINRVFSKYGYLADTHTAVGIKVYEQYITETGDNRPTVLASTASAYKFPGSVSAALGCPAENEFEAAGHILNKTGVAIPKELKGLGEREVRFTGSAQRNELHNVVMDFLNI